jgi:hypothetical protein
MGGTDYLGSLAEVGRAHYRGGYDTELSRIYAAEIVETVHRTSGDTQRLPGTNLDGRAAHRPGKDALDAIRCLLVGIIFWAGAASLCPAGTRTSNADTLPLESSPVMRNRMSIGPILMASSAGLILAALCFLLGSLIQGWWSVRLRPGASLAR